LQATIIGHGFDSLSEADNPAAVSLAVSTALFEGVTFPIKKAALATCDLFLLDHYFNLPSFFYDVIPSLTASYPVLIYNDLIVSVFMI
jgi:hypothetical protein